jgi:hypothetical protein
MTQRQQPGNAGHDSSVGDDVYDSAPSEPDDDFWLEQGRKMVADSLPTVRTAAASLTTAIGVLQGIYLGILGFAKFVPDALPLYQKALFIIPLIFWLVALYNCIDVALTRRIDVYMHSPEDIRERSLSLAAEKQRSLQWAFWLLTLGLLAAFGLLMYRLNM